MELLIVRFLPSFVTSSSSLNISLSTLFTNILNLGSPLSVWEIKFHTRRKQPNSPGCVARGPSNFLCFADSFANAVWQPDLQRLVAFQVTNLTSVFHFVHRFQESLHLLRCL
jgi:hypothetical protein